MSTILFILLSCGFTFLAGWLACARWRYPVECRLRVLKSQWRRLLRAPDPHSPIMRKRLLRRLKSL